MDDHVFEFLADLEQEETGDAATNESLVPAGERPCPICGKHMAIELQEGISIDVCEAHGMWLDRGELGTMIARIRSGELSSRREAIQRARKDGKMSGMFLGAWSLMYD